MKKYHPDKYSDNPLKDLAEEKMREINEAYDYLMKNGSYQSEYRANDNNNNYNNNNYNNQYNFQRARDYINRGDFRAAEEELNRSNSRNAEWYFLRGMISMRKGWYSQAYEDLQRAVNMDPSNYEYREALNSAILSSRTYRDYSYKRRGSSDSDLCTTCACLLCSDQCCECMGGDLINCC